MVQSSGPWKLNPYTKEEEQHATLAKMGTVTITT